MVAADASASRATCFRALSSSSSFGRWGAVFAVVAVPLVLVPPADRVTAGEPLREVDVGAALRAKRADRRRPPPCRRSDIRNGLLAEQDAEDIRIAASIAVDFGIFQPIVLDRKLLRIEQATTSVSGKPTTFV